MTPNLDVMGHRWVGALASFQFKLKYQKGTDNGAADVLSWVPINHSWQTVQSLLEGAIVGASNKGEAEANKGLLEKHECLSWEARVQAVKLELMHIVDWEQAQLSHDKKAQWEQHLLELLQAYNSTRSAVTGYSLHYLMFGRRPHLPVDYYTLTVSAYECSCHVPAYVMEVWRHFKEAYTEAHLQTNCKAKKHKRYYD